MLALALLLSATSDVRLLTERTRSYELVEIQVETGAAAANPFSPEDAAVDATVTLPSGRVLRVPGFWYQGYTRALVNPEAVGKDRIERLTPSGPHSWRVRSASPEAGAHR